MRASPMCHARSWSIGVYRLAKPHAAQVQCAADKHCCCCIQASHVVRLRHVRTVSTLTSASELQSAIQQCQSSRRLEELAACQHYPPHLINQLKVTNTCSPLFSWNNAWPPATWVFALEKLPCWQSTVVMNQLLSHQACSQHKPEAASKVYQNLLHNIPCQSVRRKCMVCSLMSCATFTTALGQTWRNWCASFPVCPIVMSSCFGR